MTHTSSQINALASEEDGPPTVTVVLRWARREGIRLELTDSKDGIMAGPGHSLTQDFRDAVQAVNPWLIRHLLVDEAMRYYARYVWADGGSMDSPAARAGQVAMAAVEDNINAIWDEAGLETFRDELRKWLKAGLAAYRKAAVGDAVEDEERATEVNPANENSTSINIEDEPEGGQTSLLPTG